MAQSKARAVAVPTPSRRVHWQALLEECRRSGLSQAEFCRRRGIPPGTLASWKHTLARAATTATSPAPRDCPAPPPFLPVRVITRPSPTGATGTRVAPTPREAIVIVLRGARQVRIRGRVDLPWLGQVVRLLERLEC